MQQRALTVLGDPLGVGKRLEHPIGKGGRTDSHQRSDAQVLSWRQIQKLTVGVR
jgi:hypothetical protein